MRGALSRCLQRFIRDEAGATAIEYGLICSLIFLAIVGSVKGLLAVALDDLFKRISAALLSAM